MDEPGSQRPRLDRPAVITLIVAVLVAAGAGAALTVAVTDDPPRAGPTVTPKSSPTPNPGMKACRDAAKRLRLFDRRTTQAYRPANALNSDTPKAKRIRVLREIGAELFAVQVELEVLDVPDELEAVYELELRFVETAADVFQQAADLVQGGDFDEAAEAEIDTLTARANQLQDVAQFRLKTFDPRRCA